MQPMIDRIRILLIHFNHHMNEYRPHQARETLILMMKQQIQKKKEMADEIYEKIRQINLELESNLV